MLDVDGVVVALDQVPAQVAAHVDAVLPDGCCAVSLGDGTGAK
jgi:hypothetical protein